MSDPTTTPTPTEPHHDVHSRRFELHRDTAPVAPDSTDVRREVARLRRALSRLWEATNAHTRDDRTYDRLRADRDTLDEALLAAVSAAAPDERELVGHLDRFIADCAAEGVEKGALSVEWAGRLRAALAARPAPVASEETR